MPGEYVNEFGDILTNSPSEDPPIEAYEDELTDEDLEEIEDEEDFEDTEEDVA